MFNGTNNSGKLYDVVNEDGEVLGSFDEIADAVECGRAAPWHAGEVKIRRDVTINARSHARTMVLKAQDRAAMDFGTI